MYPGSEPLPWLESRSSISDKELQRFSMLRLPLNNNNRMLAQSLP